MSRIQPTFLWRLIIGVVLTVPVFNSCGPAAVSINGEPSLDTVMIVLSAKMEATTYTYVYSPDETDSTGRLKAQLTFNGVKWRDRDNFAQRGTSYVAFHAFDAMPDSIRKKYSRFDITINTDSGKINQSYSLDQIAWAHFLSHVVDGFYTQILDTSFERNLDQRFISLNMVDSITTMINKVIPGTGEIEHEVIGFVPIVAPNQEQCITLWTRCGRNGKVNEINFTVSTESLQIVAINFPFGYMTW